MYFAKSEQGSRWITMLLISGIDIWRRRGNSQNNARNSWTSNSDTSYTFFQRLQNLSNMGNKSS